MLAFGDVSSLPTRSDAPVADASASGVSVCLDLFSLMDHST
ncbi:hypothetical protein RISK_005402 [Rhodopirellula islandica]|uniref:Uncharacterized protein n=1 Tax=Rhodopirellula islandica TaxID=595434 RepID=A0A0J1B779_RHOIS|nr:hypothetical protein RISK_005402 [Rhodopirellula islandica]